MSTSAQSQYSGTPSPHGNLPFTGFAVDAALIVGVAIAAAGLAFRRLARSRLDR